MRIRKFNEKFDNYSAGKDFFPEEMAFMDLMNDSENGDFDVTRDHRELGGGESHFIGYRFAISLGEFVNDGMRSVRFTKMDKLYEDFKRRFDLIEEIYIATTRVLDEYPDTRIETDEEYSLGVYNKMTIQVRMIINTR